MLRLLPGRGPDPDPFPAVPPRLPTVLRGARRPLHWAVTGPSRSVLLGGAIPPRCSAGRARRRSSEDSPVMAGSQSMSLVYRSPGKRAGRRIEAR
ncbi:hypothetical protein D3248_08975 [Leucobacter zeae]|nr:hypothetical protein [Leucobacter zeae]